MRLADLISGLTAIKVLKEFNDETTLFRLTSNIFPKNGSKDI